LTAGLAGQPAGFAQIKNFGEILQLQKTQQRHVLIDADAFNIVVFICLL
jgi:hypothetical protein